MLVKTVILLGVCAFGLAAEIEEVFAWKEMEFTWPSQAAKNEALKKGAYVPENNLPLGMGRWKNKLFVTVPRWKNGVASSLNYINLDKINKTAPLIPYPDWKANTLPETSNEPLEQNHITSVFRVYVDECDRLWVMDTGVAQILGNYNPIAKPSILVFDLNTDTLIRRYTLKETDAKDNSFFANVVVDVTKDTCDKAFAYIPDLGGYGLVVYSWEANDSWRIKHNYFHMDPLKGDLTVGGINFQWTDGVFGIALSRMYGDGYRTAYFHALASTKEFSVSTKILQDKALATNPDNYHTFKIEGERGDKTQASTSVLDQETGIMFFTQLNRDAVACWNTNKPLNSESLGLVVEDKERLIFTNDVNLDKDRNLWILSDKMPIFLYKSLDPQQINYRIFKVKFEDAIKGTPCEIMRS